MLVTPIVGVLECLRDTHSKGYGTGKRAIASVPPHPFLWQRVCLPRSHRGTKQNWELSPVPDSSLRVSALPTNFISFYLMIIVITVQLSVLGLRKLWGRDYLVPFKAQKNSSEVFPKAIYFFRLKVTLILLMAEMKRPMMCPQWAFEDHSSTFGPCWHICCCTDSCVQLVLSTCSAEQSQSSS